MNTRLPLLHSKAAVERREPYMGTSQSTTSLPTREQSQPAPPSVPPHSSARHEPDAPRTVVPPSRLRAPRVKYLQSLDRSMKVFLRSSNLPGLEYRLKLAGYRTVEDLLSTDRETLMAKGFTGIMAQQLMNAVTDYINKQVYRSEEERLPFRLVRRGQRIQTEPSETMRENPNFRKPNVKRQKSLEGPVAQRPVKRGQNIAVVRREASPAPRTHTPSLVRLMSEEDLALQHLLSPQPEAAQTQGSGSGSTDGSGTGGLPTEEGGRRVLGIIVETPSLEEMHISDSEEEETDSRGAFSFGPRIPRSFSIPADFKWITDRSSPVCHTYRVRCYSSPPTMASSSAPITSTATLVERLQTVQDVSEVFSALCLLLQRCRGSHNAREAASLGGLVVAVKILHKHCEVLKIAEVCCRLLQYLSRVIVTEEVGQNSEGSVEVPRDALSAVCMALDWHPTSRQLLTQALLAAASLCAADVYQCYVMLCQGGLESVGRTMETLELHRGAQVAGIAALATALAHIPDGRLQVLLQHGHILDLVLLAMTNFPQDGQVQQYACSFLALLVTVVSTQIESGVMQLIVEHVAITMETMSHDPHVTHWGCKVFAHAASNATLSEWKLAARCCELLSEAMRTFPELSSVQTWAAYALYQLAAYHRARVCDHLLTSDLPSLHGHPSPNLISEACSYLHHLQQLLEEHQRDQDRLALPD